MSQYYSYLNSAEKIIDEYEGKEPFSLYLKAFFRANKKYGSRDRRQVSHLCYCFFRLGKLGESLPTPERILIALFLCSEEPNVIITELKPGWEEQITSSVQEKLQFLGIGVKLEEIFPWKEALSDSVDYESFSASFFSQPNLFLRLRPNHEKNVLNKLAKADFEFEKLSESCISLPNGSKVDQVLTLDREAVIQDYNSQKTGETLAKGLAHKNASVWDCCAGSGGKSIMAYDVDPTIELTVSDVRKSIMINLKNRFRDAGIRNYTEFLTDLASSNPNHPSTEYDLIVVDAPCTGSGTWSRTPEQLYYFEENKIAEYALLQRKIATNVVPNMKIGGFLLYITCSVFKQENEAQVQYLEDKFGLVTQHSQLLKGYDQQADTLFVALLQKEK
ncbi:MAG: hypothetical protein WC967_09510 [Balneolaceae bacterium]